MQQLVLVGLHRDIPHASSPWRPVGVAIADVEAPWWQARLSPHLEDCDGAWAFSETLRTLSPVIAATTWEATVERAVSAVANFYASRLSTFVLTDAFVPALATLQDLYAHHVLAGRIDAFPGVPA